MMKGSVALVWLIAATFPPFALAENASVPADFRLKIDLFGVDKEPIASADMVVRKGVAYQFLKEAPEEVVIIDPGQKRVILFDLNRKVQTEFTSQQLDDGLTRMHHKLSVAIEVKKKSGTRSDRVAAEMTRDLIDPRLKETFTAATNTLHLTNPTVEIDTRGEPEPDKLRLGMTVHCLDVIAKLGAQRDTEAMPPFTRLDAIHSTAVKHGLRPTEMSCLYRLTGPPRRLRWTYRLSPTLTDREREALSRVEQIRQSAQFVPYERYETPAEE